MSTPQRIVSLLSSATEILFAIGAGKRVVAVSHECDFPLVVADLPQVTVAHIDAAAASQKSRTESGAALYGLDVTTISSLAPDLIVTQAQCDVCAVRYLDVVDMVNTTAQLIGTPIVPLNPANLGEVLEDIRRVGKAANMEEAAEQVVAALELRIGAVRSLTSDVDARPRVACIEWIEPLMLAANWIPELVELAGGQNGVSAGGEHSTYSEWQDLLDFDPEILILMPCGFDLARTVMESAPLRSRPGWHDLSAVRSGRVFAVDGNAFFNRSGPRLVDSLEILAHLFHPQHFPQKSLTESAVAAFQSFAT